MKGLRLYKYEKLRSKTTIDKLFASHGNSVKAYPLRLVYTLQPQDGTPARFFITVPKKNLRHAVDRVRTRRLIREAYRLQRLQLLLPTLRECRLTASLAFVYMDKTLPDYDTIQAQMATLLTQLADKVAGKSKASK